MAPGGFALSAVGAWRSPRLRWPQLLCLYNGIMMRPTGAAGCSHDGGRSLSTTYPNSSWFTRLSGSVCLWCPPVGTFRFLAFAHLHGRVSCCWHRAGCQQVRCGRPPSRGLSGAPLTERCPWAQPLLMAGTWEQRPKCFRPCSGNRTSERDQLRCLHRPEVRARGAGAEGDTGPCVMSSRRPEGTRSGQLAAAALAPRGVPGRRSARALCLSPDSVQRRVGAADSRWPDG